MLKVLPFPYDESHLLDWLETNGATVQHINEEPEYAGDAGHEVKSLIFSFGQYFFVLFYNGYSLELHDLVDFANSSDPTELLRTYSSDLIVHLLSTYEAFDKLRILHSLDTHTKPHGIVATQIFELVRDPNWDLEALGNEDWANDYVKVVFQDTEGKVHTVERGPDDYAFYQMFDRLKL